MEACPNAEYSSCSTLILFAKSGGQSCPNASLLGLFQFQRRRRSNASIWCLSLRKSHPDSYGMELRLAVSTDVHGVDNVVFRIKNNLHLLKGHSTGETIPNRLLALVEDGVAFT